MNDLQKSIWVLKGFTDAVESDLAKRIGEIEAARYCMSLHLALAELEELKRKLDRLDDLELDASGHRHWRPYPEV